MKRNLRLYFRDRAGIFFSLLGALITFVLYIVFLKQNMVLSWEKVPGKTELLDKWLISGTLATTAITTTGNAVSLAVIDREKGRLIDLMLTDVTSATIQAAYAISGIIVGTVMQIMMCAGLAVYFGMTDGVSFDFTLIPQLVAVAVLNATLWTMFNILIQSFIRKISTLSTVQSLLGTAAGFFVGVYLPIGMLPTVAQHLMNWTPAPYSASLYRRILMSKPLACAFDHGTAQASFEHTMGIGISVDGHNNWMTDTIILCLYTVLFAGLAAMLAKKSQAAAVQRR